MADIKQAAKWIREGKHVKRETWAAYIAWAPDPWKIQLFWTDNNDRQSVDAYFSPSDLLADDWMICHD